MTKELQTSKHGKTAVLKFIEQKLLKVLASDGVLSKLEVSKVAPVVNGTNEENHLEPAEGGDFADGGNTAGNGISGDTSWDELVVSTGDFGDDVANDGKLRYTVSIKTTVETEVPTHRA